MYYPVRIRNMMCNKAIIISDIDENDAIEEFGKHFFVYTKKHGYHKMIATLGSDLYTFLVNLDSLHDSFSLSNRSMVPPSFT